MGWKIVGAQFSGGYPSAYTHSPAYARTYAVGYETSAPNAPLFFFGDELTAAQLLVWGLHQAIDIVLLRVEAREPVRAMTHCAQREEDYPAFWATVLAGGKWPLEQSYAAPALSFAAAAIVPRVVAWQGRGLGDYATRHAEIGAGMDAARGGKTLPVTDKSIFLPVAGRYTGGIWALKN